jgi:hypothetical protein
VLDDFIFNIGKLFHPKSYVRNALSGNRNFFGWTVQVRSAQFLVFIGFVIFKLVSPILLATSGLEVLAGIRTWFELRQT